jgi:hypothetical protein
LIDGQFTLLDNLHFFDGQFTLLSYSFIAVSENNTHSGKIKNVNYPTYEVGELEPSGKRVQKAVSLCPA